LFESFYGVLAEIFKAEKPEKVLLWLFDGLINWFVLFDIIFWEFNEGKIDLLSILSLLRNFMTIVGLFGLENRFSYEVLSYWVKDYLLIWFGENWFIIRWSCILL